MWRLVSVQDLPVVVGGGGFNGYSSFIMTVICLKCECYLLIRDIECDKLKIACSLMVMCN